MFKFKVKNPLVKDGYWNWCYEMQCRKFGCLTTGPYYYMTQSHCRRCGKITYHASEGCKEWMLPWRLDN
jgi:hypothetical protein